MATRVIDDTKLQNIAVAIQGKDSGGTMTVDEMPTRIAAIPTQDNTVLNSLIKRTITSIENSEVTSIGSSAFRDCSNLTSVSFPNVTSIGSSAFRDCSNLTSVSFPNVTSIGSSTFYSCKKLTSASFPNATSIGSSAFYSCNSLTTLILGKRATLENSSAFNNANNAIIYVQPEDLTWYSTATNWSALYTAGRVKSIEELPT